MSKAQMLRALVKQRLTAAAEEIFGLFERTIAEYEEGLSRSKQENERQRKLLDAVFNPQLQLHRAALPSDVQKVIVGEEEQQKSRSSLDQEDPEPPHIKEEQEELWSSQEGEQLQGLEKADIKFTFTSVPVKSEEDDEEKAQSSQLHKRQTEQMKTGADGEDCGGPEPARNSDPDTYLQPDPEDKTGVSSEPETDDSGDWKETREPQLSLNSLKSDEVTVSGLKCNAGEKPFGCSECDKRYGTSEHLKVHMRSHTGEKPFSCTFCKKSFAHSGSLHTHEKIHTGEKPFSCLVCKRSFIQSGSLQTHMKIHTGEKPFCCSVCGKAFTQASSLKQHMSIHTGEKPFSCSVCGKCFIGSGHLNRHMRNHTGEKPFSCSVCGNTFTQVSSLRQHMSIHTGEKPFSCSVCNKSFTHRGSLQFHMAVHTGERPFSCSVCDKRFSRKGHLTQHMCIHTGEKRFSCSVCHKRFAWRPQVKTHKCVGHQSSHLQSQTEDNREADPSASGSTGQMETEADLEDCGGAEPSRNSDPDTHLQPVSEDDSLDSSETEVSADDWETRDPLSGFHSLKTDNVPVSDLKM
ncbi:zinc finger protein ZFP2-like isoform X1 [Epinephelus fuscoguttatus]|uniref:zinc finger protein ZFP2-like isoform X1 n=1 Tax=Epinephelus fuscoguttatus TaxID=293821 RepID=UPI0020D0DBA7|nr:zinc finger protein ZFP2-like isoform X1 [Epinephelus fuscoguttatus]